jgi:hypothetical protein
MKDAEGKKSEPDDLGSFVVGAVKEIASGTGKLFVLFNFLAAVLGLVLFPIVMLMVIFG